VPAAGHPIDPGRILAAWLESASRGTGRRAPEFMSEGNEPDYARFESGYDPADPLDQAIMATRAAVFPPITARRRCPSQAAGATGFCRRTSPAGCMPPPAACTGAQKWEHEPNGEYLTPSTGKCLDDFHSVTANFARIGSVRLQQHEPADAGRSVTE
jgi:hypothetical protein